MFVLEGPPLNLEVSHGATDALQPLYDELALAVQLGLSEFAFRKVSDETVFLGLDGGQLPLGTCDLGLEHLWVLPPGLGLHALHNRLGMSEDPSHLSPHELLDRYGPEVGVLTALGFVVQHPVANVVANRLGVFVVVLPVTSPHGAAPVCTGPEPEAALLAEQQVLQQMDDAGVPPGSTASFWLERLSSLPGLFVHERRYRDGDPGVTRLVEVLAPILGEDVPLTAVPPCAPVRLLTQ